MKKPQFRMSTNIALHSKKWLESKRFYSDVMGLSVKHKKII
jgi:hypothetical protein